MLRELAAAAILTNVPNAQPIAVAVASDQYQATVVVTITPGLNPATVVVTITPHQTAVVITIAPVFHPTTIVVTVALIGSGFLAAFAALLLASLRPPLRLARLATAAFGPRLTALSALGLVSLRLLAAICLRRPCLAVAAAFGLGGLALSAALPLLG